MSRRVSFILEIIVALAIFWIGITGADVFFISGTRSAAVTLGIIGLLFYITSTMGYVLRNPIHPISLLGSVFAIIGVFLLIMQIFGIQLWIFGNPLFALTYFALAMCAKAVVGLFIPMSGAY